MGSALPQSEVYGGSRFIHGNTSAERVRFVLMKLDSDYKHETDYFGHKFMSKSVGAIFNQDFRSKFFIQAG